jgi:hypothetical protein
MDPLNFKILVTAVLLLANGIFVGINLVDGEWKTFKFLFSLSVAILLTIVLVQMTKLVTVTTP